MPFQSDREEACNSLRSDRRGDLWISLVRSMIFYRDIRLMLTRSGLSTNFWMMIAVRSLSGALNGNVAVSSY
jgi:hypothetical protein